MLRVAKHRTLGLAGLVAAVAMLAVASVGAASALAANPEFSKSGVCTHAGAVAGWPAFTKGAIWYYNQSTCETHTAPTAAFALGAGEYGRSPFYSEGGEGKLTTEKGREVVCEHEQDLGELTGSRTDRSVVRFYGKCKTKGTLISLPCHSTSPAAPGAEEIITNTLKSETVWVNEAETEAGIALAPESAALFTEFTCEGSGVTEVLKVRGSVVGVIPATNAGGESQYNKLRKKYELVFKQTGTKHEQVPKGYWESKVFHSDFLETEGKGSGFGSETFAFEPSGQEITSTITTAEEGELKA
jgi:hypothetical protein